MAGPSRDRVRHRHQRHDICQELQAAGADVTMVQRSPTMVVNVEPAQLDDKTYLGDGPPIASATSSIPACRCR